VLVVPREKPQRDRDEAAGDDLVERAHELDERARELEEEEHHVEELEQDARTWLERQPKTHWPPLEPEADAKQGDGSEDEDA
jgi:hypothetical protein